MSISDIGLRIRRQALRIFCLPFLPALISTSCLCCISQTSIAMSESESGSVTGTVYYSDLNLPARNARVVLDPWPVRAADARHAISIHTDLDGRFSWSGLSPGEYVVSADVDGYLQIDPQRLEDPWVRSSPQAYHDIESRFTKVSIAANQTANVALQIGRGTEIRGTVVFDDGSPAIGLNITFGRKENRSQSTDTPPSFFGAPLENYSTHTDDGGHFRIRGIFPGLYQVSVVVPTTSSMTAAGDIERNLNNTDGALRIYEDGTFEASRDQGIPIESGDREKDVSITIPLASLHTVRGTIVVKGIGTSPPAAAVQLLYSDTREIARTGVGRNGNFELYYVPEGSYILRVAASSLSEFPRIHSCPPDCSPPLRPVFGQFAETPVVVTGEMDNLVVTVPPAPGAGP